MIQENTVDEETENKETAEKVSPSERVPSERVPSERVPSERVPSERVSSELVRTETCQAMSTTVGKRAVNWETTMIESNSEVKLQLCIHQLHSSFVKSIHHSSNQFIIHSNCIHLPLCEDVYAHPQILSKTKILGFYILTYTLRPFSKFGD
jgi:hypothetical protein